MRLPSLALVLAVLLAAPASARVIENGLTGGTSLQPYAKQTGEKPRVFGFFVYWNHSYEYAFDAAERTDTKLMLHIGTNDGYGTPEVISPRGIANGSGDRYLIRLNRRLRAHGEHAYIRLMAEMNQTNNAYSAFNPDGSSRGPSHSTKAFRAAWRRSALILRGGAVARINARLKAIGLRAVRGLPASETLPRPQLDMLWVPQTRGSPDIPANMPRKYWPGAKYVDWVGTDFYSRFPRFDWLNDFYRDFRGKPFVFGEWALWGSDDAGFVRQFFGWIRAHRRVGLVMYNQGGDAGGIFRLNRYPKARAEIRRQLARLPG